jgi:RHS repeat-associated protein
VSLWLNSLVLSYDYQGRRIQKKVSNWNTALNTYQVTNVRKFVYDGWNLIAELDEQNRPAKSYLWGLDLSGSMQGAGGVGGLLAITTYGSGSNAYFPCYDGNGNILALIDATSTKKVAEYEYGSFGEPLQQTGAFQLSPFRFSTKYTDDETGLVYYGYRFYNPITGRWPNRDPIWESGGVNLYGFVGNDGSNQYDLLGLLGCCVLEANKVKEIAENLLLSARTLGALLAGLKAHDQMSSISSAGSVGKHIVRGSARKAFNEFAEGLFPSIQRAIGELAIKATELEWRYKSNQLVEARNAANDCIQNSSGGTDKAESILSEANKAGIEAVQVFQAVLNAWNRK